MRLCEASKGNSRLTNLERAILKEKKNLSGRLVKRQEIEAPVARRI